MSEVDARTRLATPQTGGKKKKKRGCCFGCLMVILLVVVVIFGVIGYYWYQGLPKKSAVEKEYNSIPDRYEK